MLIYILAVYTYVMICFFFNKSATTKIHTYGHTLSRPDALPILRQRVPCDGARDGQLREARGGQHGQAAADSYSFFHLCLPVSSLVVPWPGAPLPALASFAPDLG